MKVNVIRASNPDMVMRMSLGGVQDQNTMNYFSNQYSNFMDRVGEHATTFTNSVKNIFNYITNNSVLDDAKRALTKADSVNTDDRIVQYLNQDTLHNPGLTMRRYVMASPEIYNKYEKNLCSGYEDEWQHNEKGVKANLRDDYLHVIDGEVGDEFTTFYESDNPLSTRDRFMIRNAWDLANQMIAVGCDPTNFDTDGEL